MFWMATITVILIAWIIQTIIIGGFIWFDKMRVPEERYTCWLIRGMRGVFFIVFVLFSLMFIDTNIKLIFFGVAGYGNISIHLATIILTFILAFQIIIVVVFVAPNRKGIITFSMITVYFIILWEFLLIDKTFLELSVLGSEYNSTTIAILFPILVGIVVASILTAVEELLKKYKSEKKYTDDPFWNIQVKVKNIFNLRFNLILWFFITSELLLNLQGISLLLWLTIFI